MVLVFAFVRFVSAADVGARLIGSAKIVVAQKLAFGMHEQIPLVPVDEHRRTLMQQKPPHEIELAPTFRRVDRQRKVSATLRGAILAKVGIGG